MIAHSKAGRVSRVRSPKITSGILEVSESTRLRMEESLPNYHEDHIAGKGDNSLQHYNLVHKFIPTPQAMKRKSSFCLTDGHLSFEECRIGDKAPKIQRSSCTPRRHCER